MESTLDSLLPCPHEGVIVGIDGGDLAEHVVVRAAGLLPLHGLWTVVPRVVYHHPPVMEADAMGRILKNRTTFSDIFLKTEKE